MERNKKTTWILLKSNGMRQQYGIRVFLINFSKSVAQIIDTTLLKVYVLTNPGLVANLLTLPNHCHVKECESVLLANQKYADLVLLYRGRGLHNNALSLLRK